MTDTIPSDKDIAVPTFCPACRSTDLKTTSKTIDSNTYFRCGGCGEVWNPSRRQETNRYGYHHR